jgi:polyisoprenoid-binding protein YceI
MPTSATATATTASTYAPPQTGRYILDAPKSTITFATKHMFGLGRVRGRLAVTRGSVVVADRPEDSAVEAEVSASSFSTRNPLRDVQVRSGLFLSARRHPALSFRADGVRRREGGWSVTGTLTVKGVSAPVELIVTNIEHMGASTVFTAHGTVDRYAYGVKAMPGMAARHLSFEITAHATRA